MIRQTATDNLGLVIRKWRLAAVQTPVSQLSPAPWRRAPDIDAYAGDCTSQAGKVISEGERLAAPGLRTAQFCLVTKQPHVQTRESIIALVSRLLAFGIEVREVKELAATSAVAETLYPAAHAHYAELPASRTTWDSIASRFDNERYAALFGERYSPEHVVCGAQAIAECGLTPAELTQLWEEGRRPVTRQALTDRYGSGPAEMVLDGGDSYSWFRGGWPLGIHRIASGLMAFAMKHERLRDGRPVIVLNGHFPGLAELFGQGAFVVEAGLHADGTGIDEVRRWVVGHDNRPSDCLPGTIRRDAADGLFPVDADVPVDSRRNLVHCSDGLLAGMIECHALLRHEAVDGELAERLQSLGLTADELALLVATDPVVRMLRADRRLTELTRGQTLNDCVATIARAVPPVFGRPNGFASGVSLPSLVRQLTRLISNGGNSGSLSSYPGPDVRLLHEPAIEAGQLADDVEQAGLDVIGAGGVGFVVPAAGTGGRFGGYDVPESHPRRQKALVRAFTVGGAARTSLDVRLANARYWRKLTGGRVPMAVMSGPTNREAVAAWCAERHAGGAEDLYSYQQYGTYRVRAELFDQFLPVNGRRWIDEILRFEDGSPDLKPPGNLGMLTCLVLSGTLSAWSSSGVEFLVIANGDDVGFRLEPKALGLLRRDAAADAVVMGAPWRLRGHVRTDDGPLELRGDVTGWCIDETGAAGRLGRTPSGRWQVAMDGYHGVLEEPSFDVGGSLCDLRTSAGWRPGVAEKAPHSAFAGIPLFSTNQIYLRISALQRVVGLSAGTDPVAAVRRFAESQPFYAERKIVRHGDVQEDAVQLSQGASDVLRHMSVVPMLISRRAAGADGSGGRGRHAVLKRPEDIAFAQLILDELAGQGDDLLFD